MASPVIPEQVASALRIKRERFSITVASWLRNEVRANTDLSNDLDWLMSVGGSWRPLLTMFAADLVGNSNERIVQKIALAIELGHRSSVIKDDLSDGSTIRRGFPTAHVRLGQARAIALSDLALSSSLAIAHDCQISGPFIEAYCRLAGGQLRDVTGWAASYEEALAVNRDKTATLTELASVAVAQAVGLSEEPKHQLGRLGLQFGCAAQLLNDLHDFESPGGQVLDIGREFLSGKVNAVAWAALERLSVSKRNLILESIRDPPVAPDVFVMFSEVVGSEAVQKRIRQSIAAMLADARETLYEFRECYAREALLWIAGSIERIELVNA